MKDKQHQSPQFSDNEGKVFKNETQVVYHYLKDHLATATMVSEATGVKQKNLTWYKRDLEKRGLLWEVYRAECKSTTYKAWYLTTNPENKPEDNQLSLEL